MYVLVCVYIRTYVRTFHKQRLRLRVLYMFSYTTGVAVPRLKIGAFSDCRPPDVGPQTVGPSAVSGSRDSKSVARETVGPQTVGPQTVVPQTFGPQPVST